MLTPWKESYDQSRDHIQKQRHYFANKGLYSQGYGFSNIHVWMWETLKKAECRRIYAFELWCRRRLLRVPWTARISKQSILKEISPGYSLEGLVWYWNSNTLATWCKDLTHLKRPWSWEWLRAEGKGDDRGWDGWMASTTQWTCLGRLQELVMDKKAWHTAAHGVTKSWTWLSEWTELNWLHKNTTSMTQIINKQQIGFL